MKCIVRGMLCGAVVLMCASGAVAQTNTAQQAPGHLERLDQPFVPIPEGTLPTSPAFTYTSPEGYTSIQVNVNAQQQNIVGDAANEPSMAIDPTNPSRIVVGWRQFDTITSNFRQAGIGWSHDGGQTWTAYKIDPGIFRSDPVLDVDRNGNFYYNSLTTDGGSYTCQVFKSTNGGQSWGPAVQAKGGDKQWQVVDRTGGQGDGHIYASWNRSFSSCGAAEFTRSIDGGQSFQACVAVTGRPYWGTLSVNGAGELYISGTGMVMAKSVNAKDPNVIPTFTSRTFSLGGSLGFSGGPNPGGLLGQCWVDVDKNNGNVYALASVDPSGADPMDVRFARSTDGGQTFSASIKVNDNADTTTWQWFGAMAVAPNGRIDATWYDTRDNPGTYLSRVYYSFSKDGGLTWSPNVALTPAFDPHVGWPQQNKIGDYTQIISENRGAHFIYSATFNSEEDVYYVFLPHGLKGDLNCDGVINFADINPFVLAISDPDEYKRQFPNCDINNADCNNDGSIDFGDINPFVELLGSN